MKGTRDSIENSRDIETRFVEILGDCWWANIRDGAAGMRLDW